ncbi:MAG TPA: diacylglycerol kinase family protein [Pyrinomonadaceae bacterium]|nr:diacylglycerol kinase family protein [Pyrinomonadaceae bacterium]
MSQVRSVKVIINARSGVGYEGETRSRLSEIFETIGVHADISVAESGAEIVRLAEKAVRGDWSVVIAGGGDGTMNMVASHLSGTDKVLGVLPLGTLNHFAKDLKIPLDLEGAVETALSGRAVNVDVGDVNGRIFLNNSSLGLYPSIVRERQKKQRLGSGKWPAFAWAAITAFRRYPFLHVRLDAGGEKFELKTPFVFVGNNEYLMERLDIGGRARLDQGVLSVYVTDRTSRWGLVRLALRALLGRLREERDFRALLTQEVTIETRHKRLQVAFDGEVEVLHRPLHYRSRPGALRVMTPQGENE